MWWFGAYSRSSTLGAGLSTSGSGFPRDLGPSPRVIVRWSTGYQHERAFGSGVRRPSRGARGTRRWRAGSRGRRHAAVAGRVAGWRAGSRGGGTWRWRAGSGRTRAAAAISACWHMAAARSRQDRHRGTLMAGRRPDPGWIVTGRRLRACFGRIRVESGQASTISVWGCRYGHRVSIWPSPVDRLGDPAVISVG